MSVDFKQNYFELFGLPVQYDLDENVMASNFRKLQAEHHPDRFAADSDEAKRVAQQATGFINAAQDTLKSPRLRARYLLTLKGVDFDDEVDTTSDMVFLMSQMARRETLEAIPQASDPLEAIDHLSQEVKKENLALQRSFVEALDAGELSDAKQVVLKLKFFERLMNEIKQLEERLEDDEI